MPYCKGGSHLGTVRSWMQRKAANGESVTWGSNEELRFRCSITPSLLENLAQDIRDASISDMKKDVKRLLHIATRLNDTINAEDRGGPMWDASLLKRELERLLKDEV